MFKFELHDLIWYLKDNKVHSARILARQYIDNYFYNYERSTKEQQEIFARFGNEGIKYATCHGIISEAECFPNLDQLQDYLRFNP